MVIEKQFPMSSIVMTLKLYQRKFFLNFVRMLTNVQFLILNNIFSSTDGDLRIWDVNTYKCLRTLRGHQNERNFVGLSTDGNHVMCGSENNHLYLYYKNISDPLMSFDFGLESRNSSTIEGETCLMPSPALAAESTKPSPLHQHLASSVNDFVSAICWKKVRKYNSIKNLTIFNFKKKFLFRTNDLLQKFFKIYFKLYLLNFFVVY